MVVELREVVMVYLSEFFSWVLYVFLGNWIVSKIKRNLWVVRRKNGFNRWDGKIVVLFVISFFLVESIES